MDSASESEGPEPRNVRWPVNTTRPDGIDPSCASRQRYSPPRSRHDFKVAIICALPLEASAAGALFDKRWDVMAYGKMPEDTNTYSAGVIGSHNVVLVHMPNMGKVAAAVAAAHLRASFPGIRLALMVGICGGTPFGFGKQRSDELILGDVVISEGLVQYDLGRRFPNNRFVRKDMPGDNLPRPSTEIRTVLAKLRTPECRSELQNNTLEYLDVLQQRLGTAAAYPGPAEDRLFKSTQRHMHYEPLECAICAGDDGDGMCDTAVEMSCSELGCSEQELVPRVRLMQPSSGSQPAIHFGLVATGDTVMRSGEDRDGIAARDKVIAFEMEGAGVWEVFPSSLVIKGVCDYADSHKNKRWQGYAAATAAAVTKAFLENWNTSTEESSVGTMSMLEDPAVKAREREILKKLYTSPYRDRKERNPDRVEGTCEWFVDHKLFLDWQECKSSRMLWVSADPGCGKSVLVRHLVDSILPAQESKTICYFFFKDDFDDQKSIVSALCCILHQLFKQRRDLLSKGLLDQFEAGGERSMTSFGDLWDALLTAAQEQNAGEIVCVLDALDECEDHGRSLFAKALCKLYGTQRNFNLKFLLTSRPFGGIRRGFQDLEIPGLPVIHLSGESEEEMKKISAEIDIFIKARVKSIGDRLKLRQDERDLLLRELMGVPHRTYLWVYLTLDLIETDIGIDKAGILQATSHIPKTVDEAYNRILSKSHDFTEAKKILHIIVGAARALTLRELGFALAVREHHQSYNDLDLKSEARLHENVRDMCGLFVVIINKRVYLLHQTAREFLVRNDSTESSVGSVPIHGNLEWKHLLQPRESHEILSRICIWYLLHAEFETYSFDETETSQHVDNYVFLDYSATYWTTHFRDSHVEVTETTNLLALCNLGSKRCLIWFTIFWKSTNTEFPKGFTTLMIASYFGLEVVVKLVLKMDGIQLNTKDSTYERSALSWAAGNGFDVVIKLLIRGGSSVLRKLQFWKGAEIDSVDKYGRTPLSYAVWNGNVAAIKLLLRAGARVDSKDKIGGTPLSYAICNGQQDVINLLLRKGTQVDSEDKIISDLLLSAAANGHEAVVQLLLDRGANIELADNEGQTPLSYAAERGHWDIVQLLLDKGANIESADNNGQTPLSYAAKRGHWHTVQLLLDKGANIKSADNNGRTPLSHAAERGYRDTVQVLLDKGANIESVDNNGQTPLSYAVNRGNRGIVQLLRNKAVYNMI